MTQPVCIDARGLRRDIGTHPELASADLIGQGERLQVQILARPGQKRFEKLDKRRDNQLISPAGVTIEQRTPQRLQRTRLRRQQFVYAFGQQPGVVLVHLLTYQI